VAAGPDGVRHVAPAASPGEFARAHRERFGRLLSPADGELVASLAGRVEKALAGERVEVPLDLSGTTPFQRRVMEVVGGIPRGEVRPYAWVAARPGRGGLRGPSGTSWPGTPCRCWCRATASCATTAKTGSYAFGAGEKVRLLEGEGVSTRELARAPYVATPTTGIVCHATCRNARRIRPENRRPFRGVDAAISAGYRPCKVCRPVAA
jgi:methylated-DNA-[protein]-cysteine S-methyltransferase